jgi:hypothetical protein
MMGYNRPSVRDTVRDYWCKVCMACVNLNSLSKQTSNSIEGKKTLSVEELQGGFMHKCHVWFFSLI